MDSNCRREGGGREGRGRERGREEERERGKPASMVYSITPLAKAHPEIQPATSTLCLLWFHKNIFNIQLAAFVG